MKRILIILHGLLFALGFPAFFTADAVSENVLVSADEGGRQGKGASFGGVMSADGRWVAFATTAKFLPADTNGKTDVYLKDTETGALRLVSDERGGDQPSISGDGRFVVFRAFMDIPRVRIFDRDGLRETVTVSYPQNGGGTSNAPADSGVISASGSHVAFAFRPAPNNASVRQHKVGVYRVSDGASENVIGGLSHVGAIAISADGTQVFFETTDGLNLVDTNEVSDIYMNDQMEGGGNSSLWVSRPDLGQPVEGASRSPSAAIAGGALYFISGGVLSAADADGRDTVYRATIAGSTVTLAPVPTDRVPLGLSRQASSRGDFLGYLTKGNGGNLAPFIRDLGTGEELSIRRQFTGFTSAPALTGDGSRMLFDAQSGFIAPGDRNGKVDVFLADSPLGTAAQAPPVPVLNGVPPNPINQFTGFNLSASATAGGSAVQFLSLDLDGDSRFTSDGSAIPNKALSLATGIYDVAARATDDAGVTARTAPAQIIVMPSAGQAGITGTVALTRTRQDDGTTLFSATIRVDNRRVSATGPLRLLGIESSAPARMGPNFGDNSSVPDRGQNIVASADIGSLAASGTASVEISGVVSAVETIGDGFQGLGWILSASLQEEVGGNFNLISQREIFRVSPVLGEDTPGPNGGVPVFGTPNGNGSFNPPTLQSITINGPANIAEFSKGTFTATANFSNATTKPCSPAWTLTGAGGSSISAGGVLSAGNVSAKVTGQVSAEFGGRTAQVNVSILPVTPKISVFANRSPAVEQGGAPRFQITRSPLTKGDLTVDYVISGEAVPGADFVALSGSVVIPNGSARTFVDVALLDDADFEGLEDVTIALLPAPDHKLSGRRSASVLIADDETPPNGTVDATIKAGGKPLVGRDVHDGFVFLPQFPPRQVAAADGSRDKAVTFVMKTANRGADARTITVTGAVGAAGFEVQYFDGKTDVSEQVAAGTFQFADVPPGSAVTLVMKVTPTASAGVGSEVLLLTEFATNAGSDTVGASVKRAK